MDHDPACLGIAVGYDPVAQWCPCYLFLEGFPFKVSQPKKDALFAHGHWASENQSRIALWI